MEASIPTDGRERASSASAVEPGAGLDVSPSQPVSAPASAVRWSLPDGTVPVAIGLAVLGVTSYVFLAVAARALPPTAFARLSIVWTVLFTIGPGVFLPLEQEIGRRLAVVGTHRVVRSILVRAVLIGTGLAAVLSALTLAAGPLIDRRLLDGDTALFVAMLSANATLAVVHASRGLLAGTGSFRRYGLQLGADGSLRLVGAAVLAALAVTAAGPYGWVLVGAQLLAVGLSLTRSSWVAATPDEEREHALEWRTLIHGLGWLLAGTFAAQIVVNAGTIVVKVLAAPGDAAAGHFLTALVLARVPLFLFAALQASLLPGLARFVAWRDFAAVRRSVRRVMVLLAALGTAATLVLLAAGPQLTQLCFGSEYRIARAPIVVLSIGSTLYMLASVLSQALLALHQVARVALAWIIGVGVFALSLPLPGAVPIRVSVALGLAATAVLIVCAVTLSRTLNREHARASL